MANIEEHLPGEFCWIELATTDQATTRDFYRQVFGWTFKDAPIGPNDFYTIFQLQGARQQQPARFVPSRPRGAFLRTGIFTSPSKAPTRPSHRTCGSVVPF